MLIALSGVVSLLRAGGVGLQEQLVGAGCGVTVRLVSGAWVTCWGGSVGSVLAPALTTLRLLD